MGFKLESNKTCSFQVLERTSCPKSEGRISRHFLGDESGSFCKTELKCNSDLN